MTRTRESATAPRQGPSLVFRLAIGLGLLGSLLWAGYTWYEITHGRTDFLSSTDRILEDTDRNLDQVTEWLMDESDTTRDTLLNSLLESGEWNLADAPLSLYRNEAAVKTAILERWRSLADRKREVGQATTFEIQNRVGQDVKKRLAAMKAAGRDRAEAMVDAATRRSLLTAAGVAVALILVFGIALYLTVIRPVRTLTRAARRIQKGDLDHRVETGRTDEFGVLAASFNAMVTSQQEAMAEVEALNVDLENRVTEKTAALEHTVAETREANTRLEKALEDLRATQTQLVHAEKMSAIGTLAGGIAHEFNNLLGGILGSAEAAMEEEDLGPASRQAVEMIRRTAGRANLITENLLRFARPSEDAAGPADIRSVVADGMQLAETEARKRRVQLVREDADLPPATRVPGEMHQVVVNLLVNAIHASPEGGTVTVRLMADAGAVRLQVEDEGEGIPEAHREKIFDPFFSTKGPSGGTGLGLSVSYGIVERSGGTLDFEVREGGGTRFVVELPLFDSDSRSGEKHERENQTGSTPEGGKSN